MSDTNTPPRLYALTPIDQTEGLEDGRYIVKNDYGMFEVSFDNKYQFNEEFTDCSDLTHYLRTLPPGTQVLPPGMVAVSEEELEDLLDEAREVDTGNYGEYGGHTHKVSNLIKKFIQTKLAQMGEGKP